MAPPPFSNIKLRVPTGIPNLLEGLAREVLRSQTTDIYAYTIIVLRLFVSHMRKISFVKWYLLISLFKLFL